MRVLVGCEFSGTVRDAFRYGGHDAWSCDLPGVEPRGDWYDHHFAADVLWVAQKEGPWDLMIAHPPCTYLSNSGSVWLRGAEEDRDEVRWKQMRDGCHFFLALWGLPIPRICLENPIMHKYARFIIGTPPTQLIHPWQFGHYHAKPTYLWLKNLPPLKPTLLVSGASQELSRMGQQKDRGRKRSIFWPGIAQAMVDQWSSPP